MSNKALFGKEAREKLMEGIALVHRAVSSTLGASGRNTVFNRWSGKPVITNDGVSIAREMKPEDLGQLQGVDLVNQVLEEVNDEAGDATTTTCVLYHSLITKGLELIEDDVKKVNPIRLRREIKEATEKVIESIKHNIISVGSHADLEKIAITSADSEEIGKTIAQAVLDAGENGIVYVNESDKIGVTSERVEGYQFNQGMITPYLITNPDKMETVLENPAILVTEMPLHLDKNFQEIVGEITKKTKDILIICDEIHPDVIKFAVLNLMQRKFRMSIVKKPMQGEYLEDIANLVGAVAMSPNKGKIKYSVEYFGEAEKVVINAKTTTIFGYHETKKIVDGVPVVTQSEYIDRIKAQIAISTDEVFVTKAQERLARLTGGVFLLNVGAKTPAEQRYLKDKVDDAINATRKAKGGFLPGGGVAFYSIIKDIILNKDGVALTPGEEVVFYACGQPIRQIIKNAGEEVDVTIEEIDKHFRKNAGYNALTLEVVPDIVEAGITDSVKSTISALSISASNAALFLTTDTQIIPILESVDKTRLPG